MSSEVSSDHVCYVYCNFCNTVLAKSEDIHVSFLQKDNVPSYPQSPDKAITGKEFHVSVPCTNMFNIVTVRCGHCANLLSVNMGGLMHQTLPAVHGVQNNDLRGEELGLDCGSSSGKFNTMPLIRSSFDVEQRQPINLPIRPPEKRQRVPSAYNRFIKEEIQRIKANNPDISHREAFSAAAKNWAHFPRLHFGLDSLETNKRTKLDEVIAVAAAAADAVQTAQGFY